MDSLTVISFKQNIENFVNNYNLPTEVKRLVLAEIYLDVKQKALAEALAEAEEREKENESIRSV